MTQLRHVSDRFFISDRVLIALGPVVGTPISFFMLDVHPFLALVPISLLVLILGYRMRLWRSLVYCVASYHLPILVIPYGQLLITPSWALPHQSWILMAGFLFVMSLLPCTIIWGVLGACLGVPVRRFEFRCYYCSYSLIGNTTGACPECGTPIPFKKLGLTQKSFERLARLVSDDPSLLDRGFEQE